jgi:hypothetical protein
MLLLDEFIRSYFEKQKEVKERIIQLEEDIKTHLKSRE